MTVVGPPDDDVDELDGPDPAAGDPAAAGGEPVAPDDAAPEAWVGDDAPGDDAPGDDAPDDDAPDDEAPDDEDLRDDLDDEDMVPIRGGTPVTPIGGPEELDLDRHRWAAVAGAVGVALLFLLAAFAIGAAFREGEHDAAVPRVPVPRVTGRTLEEAQRELGPLKLLVSVDYQPNEVVPPGVVFDQRPVAGAKLEIGTEVTLVVSDGPAGLTVPDVKGLQGGEAVGLLQALGFTASQQPVYDEVVRPGEVVGSNPAAGNRAVLGAPVVVLVSNGPAPHVVPAIVGMPEAQGMAALGRSGVGLGDVTSRVVAGTPPGVVLSTNPAPGASVPRDFPIDVVVSAPPASLTVPPVTGLLQASARTVLQPLPFQVTYRNRTVPYGDARAGRVLTQSIPAGTKVEPNTPLQLEVGVAAPPPTTTTTVPAVPPAPTTTVPARRP